MQGSYELHGLMLGDGTPYGVEDLRVRGLPEVRIVDRDRPLRDGVEAGPDLLGGRTITGTLFIREPDAAGTVGVWDALTAAFSAEGPVLFRFLRPGQPGWRRMMVRPRQLIELPQRSFETFRVTFEMFAPDPLIYGDTLHAESTGLGAVTGGREYPREYPRTYGTATPGNVSAPNAGTKAVWPTARITAGSGGASNLVIQHSATGKRVVWQDTLSQGQFLDIDFAEQTVMLNGTASRSGSLTDRNFFRLLPGANTVSFGGSGTATLELHWRDAWAA